MNIHPKKCTLSGNPPAPDAGDGAPQPINPATGQHSDHYILCKEERDKGFVRPVRTSYKHVGIAGPKYPLRDLTEEEQKQYAAFDYAKFEQYPDSEAPVTGRFWTQYDLSRVGAGCGTVTNMPLAIAETYARSPEFYGSTFCCGCNRYILVGTAGEFVWLDDGTRVGS